MPLFEYKCLQCGTKYEVLQKSSKSQEGVICPTCNSSHNKKLLSTFSASISGAQSTENSCASGNCEMPYSGGCASGMCGLN